MLFYFQHLILHQGSDDDDTDDKRSDDGDDTDEDGDRIDSDTHPKGLAAKSKLNDCESRVVAAVIVIVFYVIILFATFVNVLQNFMINVFKTDTYLNPRLKAIFLNCINLVLDILKGMNQDDRLF